MALWDPPCIPDGSQLRAISCCFSFDSRLHHPGPERVFAEIRRSFWILRGWEAVRCHQHSCADFRGWRAKPAVPRMADLPAARLCLFKPAFYSAGMDCFGPFKCLTTRAVHLDLLSTIDTDSFLMAFHCTSRETSRGVLRLPNLCPKKYFAPC